MGYEEPNPHPSNRHPQQSQPAALDHNPSQPPLQGPPMIVSRYLSEPDATPPLPVSGSESVTRLSKVWRVIRRGRVFEFPFPRPRQPFQRLEFWTASHPLSFKLRLYSVSEPKVDMWRGFTWETLRYWNELMSGAETEQFPIEIPDLDRLVRAEPFSD